MGEPGLPRRKWPLPLAVAAFAASGIPLYFVLGLRPIWWLAWVAPVPLLYASYRYDGRGARWLVLLGALVGLSANLRYYHVVFPLPILILVMLAQACIWVLIVRVSRRLVVRFRSWWAALAYPVLWAAVDTLMAALLPDGNWGSLAYTQSDFLPIMQTASLFGTAGVVFLVSLVASTLASDFARGRSLARAWPAHGATMLLVGAAVAFGVGRLRQPTGGRATILGLAAIDDAIGAHASAPYVKSIWDAYDRHIASLGAQGAAIIVLPEKIGVVRPEMALQWQRHLGERALQSHVWIEAGAAIDDGASLANVCWLFDPQGALAATYQKHHLAPGERHRSPPYVAGEAFELRPVDGRSFGLAICKDMHFASLGRSYGLLGACAMLVPAWDFGLDGWLESRTTVVRGVENGYAVVRCAREGFMTVSDAKGRIVAEEASGRLPGRTLLARLPVAGPLPVLYTRTGSLFGWVCVAAGAGLLSIGRGAPKREAVSPGLPA